MDLITALTAAGGAAAGGAADPNFNQTVLLLHGDGTNGAQNNTFLDSSTNNFTITRNGNTTQGTFSPFSVAEGQWSNYFDGTGDYLSVADNAAFDLGSGAFTLEAWINMADVTPSKAEWIISQWQSDTLNSWGFRVETSGTLNFYYSTNGNNATLVGTASPGLSANTWHHIAVVRNSNTVTIYVDGTSKVSATVTATFFNSSASVMVGNQAATGLGQTFTGYISNARVVKGTAVYTTAFTPPTAPLTAISGTSLLTCQSNRFVDNSTNNFAITVNGNTSVQPFSPFAPSAAYSPSVNGGSGYFDGSGDYLTITSGVTNQFDPGSAFTFECWVYVAGSSTQYAFEVRGTTNDWNASTGIVFQLIAWHTDGNCKWQFNNGSGSPTSIAGTRPPQNTWAHLCVGYDGTTTRFWLNGASVGTSAAAYSPPTYSNVAIGNNVTANVPLNGYVSGLQFVKGADVYGVSNTTITIPTAPPTNAVPSGTTELLLNFTNAGILDNTGKNNLETVGNAQVDTSVVKYGTGSMKFDGTGDYLVSSGSNQNLNVGSGDFTIEGWFYFNTTPSTMGLFQMSATAGGFVGNQSANLAVATASSTTWQIYAKNTFTTSSATSVPVTTWTHFALVRNGTDTDLYINGTAVISLTSDSTVYNTPYIGIGGIFDNSSYLLNGFIDDLRISRVARYTTTFTPPTAPFPDQ